MLSACASSTQFVSQPPDLKPPPAAFEQPCAAPVMLGDGDLTAGETAQSWGRDRVSLARCRDRHGALVDFYRTRDAALISADRVAEGEGVGDAE